MDASTEFWSVADAIHRWLLAHPRDPSRLFDFPKVVPHYTLRDRLIDLDSAADIGGAEVLKS